MFERFRRPTGRLPYRAAGPALSGLLLLGLVAFGHVLADGPAGAAGSPPQSNAVPPGARSAPASGPSTRAAGLFIEVYQDEQPWFGSDRARQVLNEDFGLVQGVDYGVNPTSDLQNPIPATTQVVIITSNSQGSQSSADNVNHPAAQANLLAFLGTGGVLVVHMADNLDGDGFEAPGIGKTATGFTFRNDLELATTNHPIVWGPDGIAGTADDLTNANIQWLAGSFAVHQELPPLPADADVIITSLGEPVLATYPFNGGTVIVTTQTMEVGTTGDPGVGDDDGVGTPRRVFRNTLHFALTGGGPGPGLTPLPGPWTIRAAGRRLPGVFTNGNLTFSGRVFQSPSQGRLRWVERNRRQRFVLDSRDIAEIAVHETDTGRRATVTGMVNFEGVPLPFTLTLWDHDVPTVDPRRVTDAVRLVVDGMTITEGDLRNRAVRIRRR